MHRTPPGALGEIRAPIIGPKNAEAATGLPWRFLRDHFPELLIEIGGKRCFLAEDLVAALRALRPVPAVEQSCDDELAQWRERVRRAG